MLSVFLLPGFAAASCALELEGKIDQAFHESRTVGVFTKGRSASVGCGYRVQVAVGWFPDKSGSVTVTGEAVNDVRFDGPHPNNENTARSRVLMWLRNEMIKKHGNTGVCSCIGLSQ